MRAFFLSLLGVPSLCAFAGCAPAQSPTATLVKGPAAQRGDALLTSLADSGFSGVALVAINGDIVLTKGYGLANRELKIPMSPNTVVQIGSNTKDFTVVAILQLMERGKLHLSDSVTKFFQNVPADKRGITIEQLARHQAGFQMYGGPDFDRVTREQEIERAMSSKLLFAPGTDRKYSNLGYSLLAAIIEIVSGKSYDQYVQDNILNPLGLHDTGLLLPHFDQRRLAHGYRGGHDTGSFLERPLAADGPYWNLRGNGGMLSTVGDMYRFYRALMSDGGGIIKPASRDLFFHPDRPAVLAGSDMTSFFFYSRNPGLGLDVFLASNSTDYPAPKARAELARALGVAEPPGMGPSIATSIDTARGASKGPVSFPDTPAGRAAKRFVEIQALADTAGLRKFVAEEVLQRPDDNRPFEERLSNMISMRKQLGPLTVTAIRASTPTEITFDARASEGTMTFAISVEDRSPFRITGIRVEAQ